MGGATGLDYAGLRVLMDEDFYTLQGDERRAAFAAVRAAEWAVLEVWAQARSKQQ